MAMQRKRLSVLLLLAVWMTGAWAGEQAVSAEQWLSRKGMTCDINNTHLFKMSTGVTDGDDKFHYRHNVAKQTLHVEGVAYQGVSAAQVLKSGNSSQLALAVSQPRFGLQVIKVAVNLTGQPYEGMGYYWVAQGSIKQNLPALKQLLTERELTGGMVSETAQGNVRVDCTIVG